MSEAFICLKWQKLNWVFYLAFVYRFTLAILVTLLAFAEVRSGLCVSYFLSDFLSREKPTQKRQAILKNSILNDKIDQKTNFAKLLGAKMVFLYDFTFYHLIIEALQIAFFSVCQFLS